MDALGLFAFVVSAANLALLGGLGLLLNNSSMVRPEPPRLRVPARRSPESAPSVLVPIGPVRAGLRQEEGRAGRVEGRFELVFPHGRGGEAVAREAEVRKAMADALGKILATSLDSLSERNALRDALVAEANRVLRNDKATTLFFTDLHSL